MTGDDSLQPIEYYVLSQCCITALFLLLMLHSGMEREAFKHWAERLIQFVWPRHQETDQEEAAEVRRMVDDVRIQIFRSTARISCMVVALFNLAGVISVHYSRQTDILIFLLVCYIASFVAAYFPFCWTPERISIFIMITYLVLLVRTLQINDPSTWFLNYTIRLVYRLVVGSVDMSTRRAAVWNTFFFLANVSKAVRMAEELPSMQQPFLKMVHLEACISALVWVASSMVETWITESVRSGFKAKVSHTNETMANHLVSAFCDAQVKLGSDLRILGPNEKLSRILLGGMPFGGKGLRGALFSEYLADADKSRFKAFIDASSGTFAHNNCGQSEYVYERLKTLPGALHVHLRDSSGREIPVELFHSNAVATDGEMRHHIGICVDSREEIIETPPSTLDDTQYIEAAPPQQVTQRMKNIQHARSSSSQTNSSNRSTRRSVCMADVPSVRSLNILFDAADLSTQSVTFVLNDEEISHRVFDNIMQPTPREFGGWVQTQTQRAVEQIFDNEEHEQLSVLYGPLTLSLQGLPCFVQSIITVKSAWLDFEGIKDCWHDDGESATVTLRLEGLQQISSSKRREVMSTIRETDM